MIERHHPLLSKQPESISFSERMCDLLTSPTHPIDFLLHLGTPNPNLTRLRTYLMISVQVWQPNCQLVAWNRT